MSGEAAIRAGMWNLRQLVEHYLALAGEFGKPAALSQFPLSTEEVVLVLGSIDEDYRISRYLHFSNLEGKTYTIGGEDVTHLSIDHSINEIL